MNLNKHTEVLLNEDETIAAGQKLGSLLGKGFVVYLTGQLGAGKTTFTRGLLSALGHSGAVKSPTYTLVEPYESLTSIAYHFDLYRLGDPEELEYMGIRDYFNSDTICIVEWPEKGLGFLPRPDIRLELKAHQLDSGETSRKLTIIAESEMSRSVLSRW